MESENELVLVVGDWAQGATLRLDTLDAPLPGNVDEYIEMLENLLDMYDEWVRDGMSENED